MQQLRKGSYPSRHRRPSNPRPAVVQQRDYRVLAAIGRHRLLTGEHVQQLCFSGRSRRAAQRRLRVLWEHGHVDRLQLPLIGGVGIRLTPPLYSLTKRGAGLIPCDIDVVPASRHAFATVLHDLVATDVLVAAECFTTDSLSVTTQNDTPLRQALTRAQTNRTWRGSGIVPDGAISLLHRQNSRPTTMFPRGNNSASTYYVEVVRAGVRGGNATFANKLAKYVRLHRAGYFKTVFGHEHVRAILILTTSNVRADHLLALAGNLAHGRNLFWFAAYQSQPARLVRAVTAEQLHQPFWRTVTGEHVALFQHPPPTADVQ
jgi:hypothetical protein